MFCCFRRGGYLTPLYNGSRNEDHFKIAHALYKYLCFPMWFNRDLPRLALTCCKAYLSVFSMTVSMAMLAKKYGHVLKKDFWVNVSIESFLECIRTSATKNLQCQQIIILSPVAFIVHGLYQSSVLRKLIAMKLGHFFIVISSVNHSPLNI